MHQRTIENIHQLPEIANWAVSLFKRNKIIVFDGKMGAGKTTLIKEIGKVLKVKQLINSPTFSIINEYTTDDDKIIYHFDCYRIKSLREAFDIGIPEYLDSDNYCFIEWAENIAPLLPENYLKISIKYLDEEKRQLKIETIN
ncbi:MAG: tRNA (adenosine(37)-N6)-threonylcarbamoyltransferase complex ATPase subunit type 1 TsaE [Paludibacter sp.]|jgi:tRNA threonylcarbamoyladenosine biosynthesis protein TsaE|nr:tRNA (adenosine(37)-N6)-threonylcarbamoyltransferase complex ATPase subunit type 1 TsaE [Paludibacter sp.]